MNRKVLFLGVGGIGVSALAMAAKRLGAVVAGYDSSPNKLTLKLEGMGVTFFSDRNEVDVLDYDMVVYSSAILEEHPLLSKARRANIECLQRAMFLAILMKDFNHSVAVTGTHGKTTTSSMLATLLCQLDTSSSFVVGGVVKYTNSNILVNGTSNLVIEADESDASFLYLDPQSVIITNIDLDHMSTYQNSYENLLRNFFDFLSKPSIETIYLCVDDRGCKDLLKKYNLNSKNVISYGFSSDADARIYQYCVENNITKFKLLYKGKVFDFIIHLPGKYNVQNAVAAIIRCLDLGFDYNSIEQILDGVVGVQRRFDIYEKTISRYDVTVIDDYGHHPAEVSECLKAIRDRYPGKKVIHVFQPHRYTRNRDLLESWAQALSMSDKLIILPTYSAGEEVIKGAESIDIVRGLSNYISAESFEQAVYLLEKLVSENTVILVQGAGNVPDVVEMLSDKS